MSALKTQINRYKKIVILLIFLIFALLFLFFARNSNVNNTNNLIVEKIQTRNVEKRVLSDGNVEGIDRRVVFFTPNLRVTEIRFNIGDKVNRDDVMAILTTIDGRTINTEIKAPIAGIVTESNYKQNDIVSAVVSQGFIIVDNSSYKIELNVNENDIVDLKAGQSAKITYTAISVDTEFKGEVERVFPDSIQESAAVVYKVIIKPTEIPEDLKLGMSAGVVITTAKAENVLSIPESFLVEKEEKIFLKFINWTNNEKTNYTIEEKEITIGLRTDEYVEVKSGASEGDEVVEPEFVPQRLSIFGN